MYILHYPSTNFKKLRPKIFLANAAMLLWQMYFQLPFESPLTLGPRSSVHWPQHWPKAPSSGVQKSTGPERKREKKKITFRKVENEKCIQSALQRSYKKPRNVTRKLAVEPRRHVLTADSAAVKSFIFLLYNEFSKWPKFALSSSVQTSHRGLGSTAPGQRIIQKGKKKKKDCYIRKASY